MKSIFYIAAFALGAFVPGALAAEGVPQVVATVTVIRDVQSGEKLMFVSRVWVNRSGEPCKIFSRRDDDTTVACRGMRPASFNLKDFPQDPIVIVRVGITRHEAAVGINN